MTDLPIHARFRLKYPRVTWHRENLEFVLYDCQVHVISCRLNSYKRIKNLCEHFQEYRYFSKLSLYDKVPWGIPCVRIEGGIYTNPQNDQNPYA